MRSRSMGSMTLAITLLILLLSAALLAASHGLLTQAIRTQGEGFASGRDRMLAESRLDEAMALLLQDQGGHRLSQLASSGAVAEEQPE